MKDKITFKEIVRFVTSVLMYSIFCLLILIGVLLLLYFIDLKKNQASGVYKPPLYSAYVIVSQSMVPSINVQDVIIIKRVETSKLKPNDVITFTSTDNRYYGITITHRVQEITSLTNGVTAFRTKGDNNNTMDSTLVSADNVLGKVIFRIPKLGYVQYFLTRSYGWIIVIVMPCLAIVIYDIIKLIKKVLNSDSDDFYYKKKRYNS